MAPPPLDLPPLHTRDLIAESHMRTLLKVAQAELGGTPTRSASPADAAARDAIVAEPFDYNEVIEFDDSYQDDYGIIHVDDGGNEGGQHNDNCYLSEPGFERSERPDSLGEGSGFDEADGQMSSIGSSYNLEVEMHHYNSDDEEQPSQAAVGHPSWSSTEPADQAYRRLLAQWERQESGEEEESDAALDYNEYMNERLECEHFADEQAEKQAAAREAKERRQQQKARERMEFEARAAERRLQSFKRAEARRVEEQLEKAEKEEQAAEKKLKAEQARLRQMEQEQSEERIVQLQREQDEENEIARLKAMLRAREMSLSNTRAERVKQENDMRRQQHEVKLAKDQAEARRAERVKAAIDCDEHESSLTINYSRVCTICQTPNPRRRAVFVACGHMACTTCADKMQSDNGGNAFPCPYCRKQTTYVKLFEDVDDVAQVPEESQPRKRKSTIIQPRSSSRRRFIQHHSRYSIKTEDYI